MDKNSEKIIGILALIGAGGVAAYEGYKILTKSSTGGSGSGGSGTGGSGGSGGSGSGGSGSGGSGSGGSGSGGSGSGGSGGSTPTISNVSVDNEGNFTITGSDFGTQNTGNGLVFPDTTFWFGAIGNFQAGVIGDGITINVYEWNDTSVEFSLNIDGTQWSLATGSSCRVSINNSPLYYFTYNGSSLNGSISTSSKYPGVGYNLSTATGSQSNPYMFDNGYQGAGYYEFTSAEYNKLLSIPASGIKSNPTDMDEAFYNETENWLNYNTSSGSSGSSGTSGSTGSTSSSNDTNGIISLSSSTIPLQNGASITISGTDFPPNTKGYVTACDSQYYAEYASGYQLFVFTTDANGNFSNTISYEYSTTQVSTLAGAFQNGNPLYIVGYNYKNDVVSSNIEKLTGV